MDPSSLFVMRRRLDQLVDQLIAVGKDEGADLASAFVEEAIFHLVAMEIQQGAVPHAWSARLRRIAKEVSEPAAVRRIMAHEPPAMEFAPVDPSQAHGNARIIRVSPDHSHAEVVAFDRTYRLKGGQWLLGRIAIQVHRALMDNETTAKEGDWFWGVPMTRAPTIAWLCDAVGCTRRSAEEAVARLREHGFVLPET